MKKSQLIFVWLVIFVLASTLGYFVGVHRGFHKAYKKEWSDYLQHGEENEEFEARVYLQFLQDMDSGDVTNVHSLALTHLRVYVSDVHHFRSEGYTWAPHIPSLYSNAVVYVREHP